MYQVFGNTVFCLASSPFIILSHAQEMGRHTGQEIISREERDSNPFRKQNKYILNETNLDLNLDCSWVTAPNLEVNSLFDKLVLIPASHGSCAD